MVNEPEQPPQFRVLPVARLRNTVVPNARHRPVKVGKSWATTAVAPGVNARPTGDGPVGTPVRSEEHTSELQSQSNLVCRLLLEKKKKTNKNILITVIEQSEYASH